VNAVRICYLANASSVHTHRWVRYFVERGHEIHVISFENAHIEGTTVNVLKLPVTIKNAKFPLKMASISRAQFRKIYDKYDFNKSYSEAPNARASYIVYDFLFFAISCIV